MSDLAQVLLLLGFIVIVVVITMLVGHSRNLDIIKMQENPKRTLRKMQLMCEQSLPPEVFEQWMNVRGWLEKTRKDLK